MLRVDELLDQLAEDEDDAAAWVVAEWASEHANTVAAAIEKMRLVDDSASSPPVVSDVVSTVTALLEALELVLNSHVDIAEALRLALQSGGDHEIVISVLEHGLEVLEASAISSPRKERKSLRSMCDRVESVLEDIDSVLEQLSRCATSELERVVECLCEASDMCEGKTGAAKCVETLETALEALERLKMLDHRSDSHVSTSRILNSSELLLASDRAFEGNMEESCRELGDRGRAIESTVDSIDDAYYQRCTALLLTATERSTVLVTWLESVLQILSSITTLDRQERRKQMDRVDAILDALELETVQQPTWLSSDWTSEQANAVSDANAALSVAIENDDHIVDVVVGFLATLDAVAASYSNGALELSSTLQSGGDKAALHLKAVLQHGIDVLDSIALSVPRKERRVVEGVCERLEAVLERCDECVVQLSKFQAPELSSLCESLCALEGMHGDVVAGPRSTLCVEAMVAALDRLESNI